MEKNDLGGEMGEGGGGEMVGRAKGADEAGDAGAAAATEAPAAAAAQGRGRATHFSRCMVHGMGRCDSPVVPNTHSRLT
jgi:hypothetical protein